MATMSHLFIAYLGIEWHQMIEQGVTDARGIVIFKATRTVHDVPGDFTGFSGLRRVSSPRLCGRS